MTPYLAAERLSDAIVQAKLVGFEGLGHSPHVEDWKAFNKELLDFFLRLIRHRPGGFDRVRLIG